MQSFKNVTVLITGASAGVGAACAREFARLGACLALVARGEEALSAIADELSQQTEVLTVCADVADLQACDAMLASVVERFGPVQILINNAGLHHRGDVRVRSAEDIATMVDVNLRAPLYLTNKVLAGMQQLGTGAVVNVGSLAGRAPLQGAATYAATKAGLRSFTYGVADEVRELGISVGVVSPGPIDTGFIMDHIDEVEDIVYSQPMSSAEEVAVNIVRLARGERLEISMPWLGGKLTTLSYLLPSLRRGLRDRMYAIGRRNKNKYRKV